MSRGDRPHGADLLHLLTSWRRGDTIVAGLAAFPPAAPASNTLLCDPCGEDGCLSLIVAGSNEQLAERLAAHCRRRHG